MCMFLSLPHFFICQQLFYVSKQQLINIHLHLLLTKKFVLLSMKRLLTVNTYIYINSNSFLQLATVERDSFCDLRPPGKFRNDGRNDQFK